MAKSKPARPHGNGLSPEFTQRMTEKLIENAIGGGGASEPESKDLPDYCGQCRFFHKGGGHTVPRCHRNPPEMPMPLYDVDLDGVGDFEYLRPPVMPEDVACGEGERR